MAVLWLGVVSPLLAWRDDLAEMRSRREALAGRMEAVAATLPALQRQIDTASASQPVRLFIEGASDAVAAATLQERIQDMARNAGVTLTSAEALPAEPVNGYRRIGLRVNVAGVWPVMTRFLQSIDEATPRMLIDDVQMERTAVLFGTDRSINASFAVFGFRTGSS